MDKKVLLFCAAVLAVSWLMLRTAGLHSAPSAPTSVLPVPDATTADNAAPSAQPITVAVNVGGLEPAAALAETAAVLDGSGLQPQLAARRAEMNRWREWAARDLKGALAAIAPMPAGIARDQAVEAVCFAEIQTNPSLAMEMAQTLQQPANVVQDLLQQWAERDSAAAFVWVSSQPAGVGRDELIQRVTYTLSQTEPEQAAQLVVEQVPPGPDQDEAVMTVVHQWGAKNLSAATAWVKAFPAGPLQTRAAQELAGIGQRQQQLAAQ
jgi:hypothetical protein